MRDLVGEMLDFSDNTTAELLTKELGVQRSGAGSTAAGVAAIMAWVGSTGLDATGVHVVDGSGLSRENRATCRFLGDLLTRGGPTGPLAEALAKPGQPGTLDKRFTSADLVDKVRAKTGTLDEVTALSGWETTNAGRNVTFSIIINTGGRAINASDYGAQQNLLQSILTYPQTPAIETISPAVRRRRREATAPDPASTTVTADRTPCPMFPLGSVLLPGMLLPLHVFEDRYRTMIDDVLAATADRSAAAGRVRRLPHRTGERGRRRRRPLRCRVHGAHPRRSADRRRPLGAPVGRRPPGADHRVVGGRPVPDGHRRGLARPADAVTVGRPTRRDRAGGPSRRGALASELGSPGLPADLEFSSDIVLRSYQLAVMSPLGSLDRQRLLAAPDVARTHGPAGGPAVRTGGSDASPTGPG